MLYYLCVGHKSVTLRSAERQKTGTGTTLHKLATPVFLYARDRFQDEQDSPEVWRLRKDDELQSIG